MPVVPPLAAGGGFDVTLGALALARVPPLPAAVLLGMLAAGRPLVLTAAEVVALSAGADEPAAPVDGSGAAELHALMPHNKMQT